MEPSNGKFNYARIEHLKKEWIGHLPTERAGRFGTALSQAHKKFVYQEYPGVGHWFTEAKAKADFYERLLSFMDENLKVPLAQAK